MVQQPNVSILIVSYNTRELTCDCLKSIAEQTDLSKVEVIVWDNASTDGSASAIRDTAPFATLIESQENLGFALANNRAAAHATGSRLLLLNPDTVVTDRAIEKLINFSNCCPDAQIWGGRTIFPNGSLNPASCWRRITYWSLFCRATGLTGAFKSSPIFNSEAYAGWPRNTFRPVDIVSGCFLLITRELWDKLNGFSPRYFMYGDDADLCLRARSYDATPMITPEAVIVHYGGASETNSADKLVRLLKAKSSLIDDHFPAYGRGIGKVLLAGWPLSRAIALNAAALFTSREAIRDRANTWTDVWKRRRVWFSGYPRQRIGPADANTPKTAQVARS